MILFWTGRRILIFIIFIAMCIISGAPTITQITIPPGLSIDQSTNLTIAIAAFLSALVTYPIGRFVMRSVDAKDTLLWIDARYWTYILAVISVLMLAVTFLI
jgi:hypothetical protein